MNARYVHVAVVFYLAFVSSVIEPGGRRKARSSLGSHEYDDSKFNVKEVAQKLNDSAMPSKIDCIGFYSKKVKYHH